MNRIRTLYRNNREIVSYLFWGVLTAAVSWGSYALFVKLLSGFSAAVAVGNILSWVCAVLFSFFTNKRWVFRSRSYAPQVLIPELLKFVASRIATGALEMAAVPLAVRLGLDGEIFGIAGGLSKVVVSLAVVVLNYILSKFTVFLPKKPRDGQGG